jgi:hypothetical protein
MRPILKAAIPVVLALIVAAPGLSHAAEEKISTVVAVKGKAVIEREKKEKDAKVKDGILMVDTVSTREASRAKMLFIDDSILTLGENSKVVIQEYVYSKEQGGKSIFNLLDGKMKAVVGKANFEVHTPTAIAAARGTVIFFHVGVLNGVPFTHILCTDGHVLVTQKPPGLGPGLGGTGGARGLGGAAGGVTVGAGSMVTIGTEPTLPNPLAAPPAVIETFNLATSIPSSEIPLPPPPTGDTAPTGGTTSRLSTGSGTQGDAGTAQGGTSTPGTNLPLIPPGPSTSLSTTRVSVGANFP